MKRTLPGIFMVMLSLLSFGISYAQVKGDPVFGGVAAPPADMQKSSTRISPDLKKLYENFSSVRSKAIESTGKPSPINAGSLNKYMQIRGDRVVVDVTIKDDLSAAKAELLKMGMTITGTFGRVISGTIAINSLPQL
ncbi:MAG TPA: hypothetical protein VNU72_02685, partial [Puia sp.]|nr:hypothetical protein [Puia sp.]